MEETKAKRDYKDEYKKFQSSTKSKKYRAELNKYNRKKGTYGNGDGKDASHKGGKIAGFESQSKNRGRAEKSRLKKEAKTVSIEAEDLMNFLMKRFKFNKKKAIDTMKKAGFDTSMLKKEDIRQEIEEYVDGILDGMGEEFMVNEDEDVDEGFGGDLKGSDKKKFEKARKDNAEQLGYTLTGTSEIRESESINEGPNQMTQVYKDLDNKFKKYDHTRTQDFNKVSKYLKNKFGKGSYLPDTIASFYNDYKGGEDMKKNINRLTKYAKKMKGYKKESVDEGQKRGANNLTVEFGKSYQKFTVAVNGLAKSMTNITGDKTDEKIIMKAFKKHIIPFVRLVDSWNQTQQKNPHIDEKKGDFLDSLFPKAKVDKAIKIAKSMGGDMSGAVKKIEKMFKGMSKHTKVQDALRQANEGFGGQLKGADKKKFEKARTKNGEQLGYKLTGTSDVKVVSEKLKK